MFKPVMPCTRSHGINQLLLYGIRNYIRDPCGVFPVPYPHLRGYDDVISRFFNFELIRVSVYLIKIKLHEGLKIQILFPSVKNMINVFTTQKY